MMNYNEFKAAKCAKCENNCAAGYGCDFTEDYMNYVKEENNMKAIEINKVNSIKEEKKMNNREAKIEKVLAKATEVYQYPIFIKNSSREQEPVRLKDLRFWYNLSYKAEHNQKFNRLLYRLKHGAALVDDANNIIYQNDEGYYACMLTSANRYRSAAQHLIPKHTTQHDAVGIVIDYCNTMNSVFTDKFLHDIYSIVCGVGLVHYVDEGFGSRKELYAAAKKYTIDDTLLLRDFDVYAPRVSIFNGYLVNRTKFVEPTICCSEVDEMSYNKGYYTSAISTANYRTYAPKDERLSYEAEKNLELGWSDRETERQADYDEYLDHAELGMFDKGITHTLADAWREFAATLSEEDKEFFKVDTDYPQGLTEYDPEQEGFAFNF